MKMRLKFGRGRPRLSVPNERSVRELLVEGSPLNVHPLNRHNVVQFAISKL